jgi:hypothetical protein
MNLIQTDGKKVRELLWTLTQFIRYSLQMGIGFFYIWSLLGTPNSSALSSLISYRNIGTLGNWSQLAHIPSRVSVLQMAIPHFQVIRGNRRQESVPSTRGDTKYVDDQDDRFRGFLV